MCQSLIVVCQDNLPKITVDTGGQCQVLMNVFADLRAIFRFANLVD